MDEISSRWNRFAMKSAYGRLWIKTAIFRWRTRKALCTSTRLLQSSLREPQRRRESECQAPDKSTLVAWCTNFLPPSDKWHNERTVINVRAPSVAPLRKQMRGNTWGRGGYTLRYVRTRFAQKKHPIWMLFCYSPKDAVFNRWHGEEESNTTNYLALPW